jgi:hypothetical protein
VYAPYVIGTRHLRRDLRLVALGTVMLIGHYHTKRFGDPLNITVPKD